MRVRKFIAIVLTALLVIPALSASVFAAGSQGSLSAEIGWTISDDGTLTVSGSGAMPDWTFNNNLFLKYTDSIKKVVVDDGITSIGAYAFCQCTNITSARIASSVKNIGNAAFDSCSSLAEITFESGSILTTIGSHAFSATSIKTLTLPESVETIGGGAFASCKKLSSISLPKKVQSIDEEMFYQCDAIQSVYIYNPACIISENQDTFWGASLFGYANSTTYTFAKDHNVHFTSLGPIIPANGDIDGSGKITAADARLALRYSAKLTAFTQDQFKAADVNGDGYVTASDARKILRVAASIDTL